MEDNYNIRYAITSNLDQLINYGKLYQKPKNKAQLSLFDDVETINKPKIEVKSLTPYAIQQLLSQEKTTLGIILSKDIYEEHLLKEHVYCNANLSEVFFNTENKKSFTFLAEIVEYTPNYDKQYCRVLFERNGYELKGMMFRDEFSQYFRLLNKFDIFICLGVYDLKYGSITIRKIKPIKDIKIFVFSDDIE
ncbi:MAG: hypothetical protein HGA35_04335, partial [Erysipelotrichaceae bacterium]|nr:hypothetical protein [Erysipelotrichaceae bacterium]